jgi:transposase
MPAFARRRRSRRPSHRGHIGKPHGILSSRVQAVGPERFGIVAVDCAKHRSKFMLTDFYGVVRVPPTVVEHHRAAFSDALAVVRSAVTSHGIKDLVVAVERTGRYHQPIQRAFAAAGYETRIVHPSISRYFREAATYDNKTDDTDLEGICRAAINGFGLSDPPWDAIYRDLQFWSRWRRDLVWKTSELRCQIREHLEVCLPGYSKCFDDIFISNIALFLPRHFSTPRAIVEAGLLGLSQLARQARVGVHRATLVRILGWASNAPAPADNAPLFRRLVCHLDDDRVTKEKQIESIEQELIGHLVQTPYVRLLALPGINVVLASEFAGEAGPITRYATARVITGRAGLYPRRYQSDEVDHASGSLAHRGNRRLRYALMMGGDTLLRCCDYFRVLGAKWADQGRDPRCIRVRVAGRYVRIAFQMVGGTNGFHHPACQGPPAVLSKLIQFQSDHGMDPDITRTNLQRAAAQLPRAEQARERTELHARLEEARSRRGAGARLLSAILPAVLHQLVGGATAELIESTASGETP